MMMPSRILGGAAALLLLAALPTGAAAQQTLILANGDQLTGALTRIADGQWVFTYAGKDLAIAAAEEPQPIRTPPERVHTASCSATSSTTP